MKTYKEIMIETLRDHQYYKENELEAMTEDEVNDIYERLIDWLG